MAYSLQLVVPDQDSSSGSDVDPGGSLKSSWMLEVGRQPNDGVDLDLGNLGSRSIDHFDWVGHAPGH